jgi:hypothetical protein
MIKISTRITAQNRPVASQRDYEAFRAVERRANPFEEAA